ncbi:hypothetical protein SAMN04488694_12645 [Natrinema hispanicum]|uniref:Uncharacterized protein n=1 Tax=Natrinema hispanicum TaxID=392421 RepID=A0A1I0IX87_9EURY|nr:hypothetical protein SAMN04488694_12645 [Natrinema hispanicum]
MIQREDFDPTGESCPDCGSQLQKGPKGRLYCLQCGSAKVPRKNEGHETDWDGELPNFGCK